MTKKAKQQGDGDRRGNVVGSGSRGNPPHKKTEELARQVQKCSSLGLTQIETSVICNISEDTIQRHYRVEWDGGKAGAKFKHASRAWDVAMGVLKDESQPEKGYIAGLEPNPAMLIWLDKTKFGARETTRHEIFDPHKAINVQISGDDADL